MLALLVFAVFSYMQVKPELLKFKISIRLDFRNDSIMSSWICSANLTKKIPIWDFRSCLNIYIIKDTIRYNHLHWFCHNQNMDEDVWSRKIDLNFSINYLNGSPKRRWLDKINHDLISLLLVKEKPRDQVKWRSAIRPFRHVVNQFNPC